MDISLKMGQYGHAELKADYQRRENEGQDPRLTMGRRVLRIGAHLIRHTDFFVPPSLLRPDSLRGRDEYDALRDYYARAWDKVLIKWRDAAAIQQAFAEGTPLEQWRTLLNERYDLKLGKLSPQYDRLRQR